MMSLDGFHKVAELGMKIRLYAGHRVRHQVSGDIEEKPYRYRDLG